MAALDSALASKELATVNAEEIRESIRKAIDEGQCARRLIINRRSASDAVEKNKSLLRARSARIQADARRWHPDPAPEHPPLARDREGRLRQELRQADGSAWVFINDPVDKAACHHDPQKKTACRAEFNERAINDCYSQIKGRLEAARLHAQWRQQQPQWTRHDECPRDDIAVEVSPRAQIIDLTRKASSIAMARPWKRRCRRHPVATVAATGRHAQRQRRQYQVSREKETGHRTKACGLTPTAQWKPSLPVPSATAGRSRAWS